MTTNRFLTVIAGALLLGLLLIPVGLLFFSVILTGRYPQ